MGGVRWCAAGAAQVPPPPSSSVDHVDIHDSYDRVADGDVNGCCKRRPRPAAGGTSPNREPSHWFKSSLFIYGRKKEIEHNLASLDGHPLRPLLYGLHQTCLERALSGGRSLYRGG